MLIPSETLILSYCNIFTTHRNIHVNKFVDNTFLVLGKQIQQLLLTYKPLVFYLKANYHLIQI